MFINVQVYTILPITLGSSMGVKSVVLVGGMDMHAQGMILEKKPHIIIATPGRLVDHLENTKGFNLRQLKFLVITHGRFIWRIFWQLSHHLVSLISRFICKVMDEADRILNMDFEVEVDKILRVIPRERRTLLFSATMTKKVQKLQRASLRNPVKVEVSTKYQTVEKLQQYYIFIPVKFKVWYKLYVVNYMLYI